LVLGQTFLSKVISMSLTDHKRRQVNPTSSIDKCDKFATANCSPPSRKQGSMCTKVCQGTTRNREKEHVAPKLKVEEPRDWGSSSRYIQRTEKAMH
jgi:hypothetical protein